MKLPDYFISCDWGTSNFRLKLVETSSLKVLFESSTVEGVKSCYDRFLEQENLTQEQFFSNYLKEQIQNLPVQYQNNLVVCAGMASSSMGLYELPYADFPFHENGKSLKWKYLSLENGLNVLVISGIKDSNGMMRGEEVQAIGLFEHLKPYKKGVLLLPGTHCKHIFFTGSEFISLKNFMTGELFEVLSRKSILRNSIANNVWNSDREEAFKAGVILGVKGLLSASLLSIRAKDLIENIKKEDNYYLLSGMLIGDELSYLKQSKETVFLAAPEPISSLYRKALEQIIQSEQLVVLEDYKISKALLVGQKKIIKEYVEE